MQGRKESQHQTFEILIVALLGVVQHGNTPSRHRNTGPKIHDAGDGAMLPQLRALDPLGTIPP
jgi:hypothetical protein